MRGNRSAQIAVTAVLVLLGFLAVVQLRSQTMDQALAQLSVQDLTELVANLTAKNTQLRDEIRGLETQRTALQAAALRGESSAASIRNDLQRLLGWSGSLGVRGAGVRVTVSGRLPADGLNDLINELWNAGAEAISLDGIRIVPGIMVAEAADGLDVPTLDGVQLPDQLELLAVGQPETLAGSLTRAGGPIAQLAATYPDVTLGVSGQDLVEVNETGHSLAPVLGKPRL
jgi:uncharacterized protein YlxW (UPF0749 family)